jgi:hypothetical protein
MDWLTFIERIVGHLTWPAVAILAVYFFKDKLAGIMGRIYEFKGLGFEAKMREVTEVVETAKGTIKELQELAKVMASISLSLVKRAGRLGPFSDADAERIKDSVTSVLRQLDVSNEESRQLFNEWHMWDERDYADYILAGSTIPKNMTPQQIETWKLLRRCPLGSAATPEEITEFLKECGLLTQEAIELIEDYKWYREHRTHKRPEVWERRAEWEHQHLQKR